LRTGKERKAGKERNREDVSIFLFFVAPLLYLSVMSIGIL